MFVESPNVKGAVAELAIAKAAAELGLPVYLPLTEHGRCDLVIEIGGRLVRVQCKWARLIREKSVIYVQVGGNRSTPNGYVRSVYTREEVDFIAAYCSELDRCYLVPIEEAEGHYALHLRLEPAKNGQRAGIREAARFELRGAVAQLARASAWHAEGRGFESPQLHQWLVACELASERSALATGTSSAVSSRPSSAIEDATNHLRAADLARRTSN